MTHVMQVRKFGGQWVAEITITSFFSEFVLSDFDADQAEAIRKANEKLNAFDAAYRKTLK